MSTVRIQVRRGTSSEWTSANPVLAAGEMGVETNTNKFKFGNGTDTWTNLAYAAADAPAIAEISQDAINTALSMGAGLTKTYNDGANTITISVDNDIIATVDYVDTAVNAVGNSLADYIPTADRGVANGVASLNSSGKVPESELDLDGLSTDITTNGLVSGSTISTPELVATDITSGGQIDANNVVISGNLTVTGTTTTVNTSNLTVSDPLIQVASDNNANTVDVGFVGHYNDGTSQHTGLVRDSSESKWKLFKGVTSNPTTNVDFTQGSLDALAVGAFEASSASIGNVSNTELQYLDGVTGPIQTQIGSLQSNITSVETNLNLYATKVSPTISNATLTGTLSLPTDSIKTADIAPNAITAAKITDGVIADAKIAANAAIAQTKIAGLSASFAEKAPVANPTFTGSVTLPSSTSVGSVSAAEIGYLDGVTSAIQTQLDGKAASSVISDLSSHSSATTNVHGIADTSVLATATTVATAKSEAIAAAGTAADSKVATAVAALTKSSVGLGNVDNTSDANKPVSTAQQTALNLKANLAGPTFTGTVVLPSTTSIGNVSATEIGYVDGVTSAIQTQLDSKAPTASPTFTGTVAGITKSMVGLANVDNTSDASKPISTATQSALDAKLALAGGTMTGALTLSGAPTADLHAATKAYVDNVSSSINFHAPVRVATTANITLSGTQTIDGVSLSVGDRVLVKDQTTQTQNGIYVVASGAWSRATDADNNPTGELAGGDFTLVLEGTVGSGYGYVCSNTSAITVGTTNVTYVPFNAAKAVSAGAGLTESTPGTLDIATGGVTSAMIADGTIVDADINASAAIAQSKISGLTTALAAKAPLADPTFTGTVSGITKAMVGLGNVDNTSDANKPVSTATQTALNLKANIAAPTFTGLVTVSASGVAFADGTQTAEGVPSRTPIIQKTASYTLSSLSERDSMIEVASASATTITIPANSAVAYPVGTSIDILQTSTGQVTIAAGAGVTVNATPGLKLRTQWSGATLFKRATDTWVVYGDLSA